MAMMARRAGSWMSRSRSARFGRSADIGACLHAVLGTGVPPQIDGERREACDEDRGAGEEIEKGESFEVSVPGRGQADADDRRRGGEEIEAGETDPVGEEQGGDGEEKAVDRGEQFLDRSGDPEEHGQGRGDDPGYDGCRDAALRAHFLLLERDVAGPRVGDAAFEEAEKPVDEEE